MITIAHSEGARVVIGVDTHKDEHVAVAVDRLGTRLGEHRLRVNSTGYAGLERWAIDMGDVVTFGVEGTGGPMFGRILVPLDGSGLRAKAIPYAAKTARRFGGKIELLRVVSTVTMRVPLASIPTFTTGKTWRG